MLKALRKVASSIFAPAKTEPIWTLAEPVIKVFANPGGCAPPQPPGFYFTPCRLVFKNSEPVIKVFANGGGLRPRNPPACLCAMQAVFEENRTINKNFVKRSCYGFFLWLFFKSSYRLSVCK